MQALQFELRDIMCYRRAPPARLTCHPMHINLSIYRLLIKRRGTAYTESSVLDCVILC